MLANHHLAHADARQVLIITEGSRGDVPSASVGYCDERPSPADAAWDLENLCSVALDASVLSEVAVRREGALIYA